MSPDFKSGFICILGPTNSGKSTLLNALVGQKVSIVSSKVQTTYHGIRGVVTRPEAQLIFTDTPGFQRFPDRVAKLLNFVAEHHAGESEISLWVFDVSNPQWRVQIGRLRKKISSIGSTETRILVLNKIDKIAKEVLLPILKEISEEGLFAEVIPISALKKDGTQALLTELIKRLPLGILYYPEEAISDRSISFRAAELIREKIYELTYQEVPYSVRVVVESWEEKASKGVPSIHVSLCVDSESQKPILIGKGGEKLKAIGSRARREIEKLLGYQVCLKLNVKIEDDWKSDSKGIKKYLELSQ